VSSYFNGDIEHLILLLIFMEDIHVKKASFEELRSNCLAGRGASSNVGPLSVCSFYVFTFKFFLLNNDLKCKGNCFSSM
jgi:hypothetical protein